MTNPHDSKWLYAAEKGAQIDRKRRISADCDFVSLCGAKESAGPPERAT